METEKLISLFYYGDNEEYFPLLEVYFVEEYKSLCSQDTQRRLDLFTFQNNFKMPLLISTQIFNSLDKTHEGYLTKESYVRYFMVIFSGSIESRLLNLFSFLEYQQEGFFYKEDMAVLFRLLYASILLNEHKNTNNYDMNFIEQLIDSFFRYTYDKSKCLSYDELRNIIINDDSSLFLIYYYIMDHYKTFNKECLDFFKVNKVTLNKKAKTEMKYSNTILSFQRRNDYRTSSDYKSIRFPQITNNSDFHCFIDKVSYYIKQPSQSLLYFFCFMNQQCSNEDESIDLDEEKNNETKEDKEEGAMSELDELELFEKEVISAKSSYKDDTIQRHMTLSSLSGLLLSESKESTNNNTLTINKEQDDFQLKRLSCSPNSKLFNDSSEFDFSIKEAKIFTPLKISFPSLYFIEDEIMIKKENSFLKYKISLINSHIFISKWRPKLSLYSYSRILPISYSFIIDNNDNNNDNGQANDYYPIEMISMVYHPIKQFTFYFLFKEARERFSKFIHKRNNYRKIEEYYTKNKKIGSGHFSEVYLGHNKKTNKEVAIKIITRTDNIKDIDVLKWEIDIFKFNKLNPHHNILQSIDIFQSINHVFIVLEYTPLGSLTSFLSKSEQCLPSITVEHILIQLINTLKHLEHFGIIHRDIKAENIMIQYDIDNKNNEKIIIPKIGDFGLAQMTIPSDKRKEFYGTLLFTAPEILQKKEYDSKVDVWSLGILTYYLEFTFLPFKIKYNQEQNEVAEAILFNSLSIPNKNIGGQKEEIIHRRIRNFIKLALQKDNELRPKISNINYEACSVNKSY